MANPQQPELRRSGRVPALDPDASEAKLSAQSQPREGDDLGRAPADQRPGHHPAHEQDKPDLDAFAQRLGVAPDGDEAGDAPTVTERESGGSQWKPQWRRVLVPAAVVTGLFLAGVLRRRRH